MPCSGDFIPLSALLINVNQRIQQSFLSFGLFFFFNISGFSYVLLPLSFPSPFISGKFFVSFWIKPSPDPYSVHLLLPSHMESAYLPVALSFPLYYRFSCLSLTTSLEVRTYTSLYSYLLMWHLTHSIH